MLQSKNTSFPPPPFLSFPMCFLGLFFVDSPRKTTYEKLQKIYEDIHEWTAHSSSPVDPRILSYPELSSLLNISTENCLVS